MKVEIQAIARGDWKWNECDSPIAIYIDTEKGIFKVGDDEFRLTPYEGEEQ